MGLNWSKENCYVTTRNIKQYTVILDLDNTLIGDISPLSKQNHVLKKYLNKTITEDEIFIELEKGLLRPYVKEFIIELMKHNIYIVIYTMSEKEWAHKVIRAMSRIIGMNFTTMILTREDCTKEGYKSIKYAVNKLQIYGYGATFENTLMIEDTNNIVDSNNNNALLVAKYVFKPNHYLYEYTCKTSLINTPALLNDCIQLGLVDRYELNVGLNQEEKVRNSLSLHDDVFLKMIKKFSPDYTCHRRYVE